METPATAVQTWWSTATPRSRGRALGLDPLEAVPDWLAGELAGAGVPLAMGLFTQGQRIARRYVQSPELRAHLAGERAAVPAA
jgi:hypothetical protein